MSGYMSRLLGLLLYVINIYFSNGAQESTVLLTCSSTGPNYQWSIEKSLPKKHWEQLNESAKYVHVDTSEMTIRNAYTNDTGNYLCYGGTYIRISLTVIIVTSITSSYVWLCPHTSQNYRWQRYTKNGWFTLVSNGGKYGSLNTNKLTINRIDHMDSGQYRCIQSEDDRAFLHVIVNGGWSNWSGWTCSVTCGVGTHMRYRDCNNPAPENGGSFCQGTSKETDLTCYSEPCESIPSIEVGKPSYNAGIGGNITLECNIVKSNPELQDLWWSNSELRILNRGRYSGGTISNPSLTITGVIASDSGYYYCNANNAIGSSNASLQLFTGNYPKADIVLDRYVSTKGIGVSVTIECKISYGDNIIWYKDNVMLQQYNKQNLDNLNHSNLVINDVKTTDRGVYICNVTNKFGSQSDETSLKVVYTESLNSSYVNTANESVSLNCVICDATEVKWRKNDEIILTDSGRYSGGNTTVPSLTITKLTREDSGMYHCESLFDSISSIGIGILLRIRDTPVVKSSTQDMQTTVGEDAFVPCSFEAYPNATNVIWTKDGKTLNLIDGIKYNGSSVNNPSLTIYNFNNSDTGIYVCYVTNQIGTSSGKPIHIAVKETLESASLVGPVAGGVSAVIFLAIVVAVLFLYNNRKTLSEKKEDSKSNTRSDEEEFSLTYNQEAKTKGVYINIGHTNLTSALETDDDLPVTNTVQKSKDDYRNTYYNIDDVTTAVPVETLKSYIAWKETNNGLKDDYKKIPYGILHPTTQAELKENMPKNRFKTTFPYDHTRLILQTVHGTANSDYINANYVDGFNKDKCYIASQGPIKLTLQDHWRMIWQNNTRKIVMLTNLVEGSKVKCERYWPIGGKPMTLDNIVLTLESEKERAAYVTREISVEDKESKEKRSVIQYHFTAWPDHGTPDPLYIVLFHKHFMNDHKKVQGGPVLVHCSAGIGRTGTFIAFDALFEEGRSTGNVDIVKFVKKMRNCRMNMIQTADQYVCLHHALLEAFTMEDTSLSKEKFGTFWCEIHSDKRPLNQQRLNEEFRKLNIHKSEQEDTEYKDATSTENIDKNRHKSVLPMDNNRVFLVSFEKGRSNYINAVQVPSYTKLLGYITTQLPLPDTKIDFWTMIRDQHSSTIVLMLNDLREADLVYAVSDDSCTCGPFSVKIKRKDKIENNITEATLVMTRKDEKPREIALYQTICNDRPNPQDLCRLDNLLSTRISMSSDPVTVVSCDGAKNCGLFCTFINAVSSMQIDSKADVFQIARLLQLRRPEFFSDYEEYRLVYDALNFYLESTNVYAN